MKITILGWYGTETIGDRAILAGLFSFFSKTFNTYEVYLGSLFPFFSERTIIEDSPFWKKITGSDVKLSLFNSKNRGELVSSIKKSDLIVMGGGPLMHIDEVFMIEYAFKSAKKMGRKTALLGCGIGPVFTTHHKKAIIEIVNNSDLVILRDSLSKESLIQIFNEFHIDIYNKKIFCSFDPAVECCLSYNHFFPQKKGDYIAINLRSFPMDYSAGIRDLSNINTDLLTFIRDISLKFPIPIYLVPMHYFHIGNDDREFLNSIRFELHNPNIVVQNTNLSLESTISIFRNALFTIGMRFHSVLIQTISHGNNYILDYTDNKNGKIEGFITDIDKDNFYSNRKISLQQEQIQLNKINFSNTHFQINEFKIKERLSIYKNKLKDL